MYAGQVPHLPGLAAASGRSALSVALALRASAIWDLASRRQCMSGNISCSWRSLGRTRSATAALTVRWRCCP